MTEALPVQPMPLAEPLAALGEIVAETREQPTASVLNRRAIRPGLLVASIVMIVLLAAALSPALIAPGDPLAADPRAAFLPPSFAHWLGTDENGRDELTRLVHGTRASLLIGFSATFLIVAGGTALGLAAGFGSRLVDGAVSRLLDTMMAFPELLLPLVVITFWGSGTLNGIIAIGVSSIPRAARLVRAQTLVVRRAAYVEAARTLGLSGAQILWRHVLPNALRPVFVLAPIWVGTCIAMAAILSFLGFGAPPPAPEWGAMLAMGRNFLPVSWWLVAGPAGFITVTVLAITTLGRALMLHGEGRTL
jgi:peptide/nickel transport system permease protein